jgi:capsular polysaccharide biosynthesis protein
MELAEILKILWSRRLITVGITILAVAAAVGVRIKSRSVPKGAATVQILIDSPQSAIADLVQNTAPLTSRAGMFAQVMASQAVVESIGKTAGVPASEITAEGPYSGPAEKLDVVTPAEARGSQLAAQSAKYRLSFVAQENQPVVTASVQAPTSAVAARLANSIYPGVVHYVSTLQQSVGTPAAHRVTIRELGAPEAGTVNSGSSLALSVVAALGVFILGVLALIGVEGARLRSAQSSDPQREALGGSAVELDRDGASTVRPRDGRVDGDAVNPRSAAGVGSRRADRGSDPRRSSREGMVVTGDLDEPRLAADLDRLTAESGRPSPVPAGERRD